MFSDGGIGCAAVLHDGRVLVAGGDDRQGIMLASAQLFDPASGGFSRTGSMAEPMGRCVAVTLPDGRVFVDGGGTGSRASIYDPNTGKFDETGPMAQMRTDETATLLTDGRVLVAGGQWGTHYLGAAEVFDPKTNTFSEVGPMRTPREDATAILLADGRVLVAGGDQGNSGDRQVFLKSAEIYDPATARFSTTGSMSIARSSFPGVLLHDHSVLVAGGFSDGPSGMTDLAETYDPATGMFKPVGPMTVDRADQSATLLSDGKVLIAGTDYGDTAETYDPAIGTFSNLDTTSLGESSQASRPLDGLAVALLDGRVLFVGAPSVLYWP
jgi:hypothetical protein